MYIPGGSTELFRPGIFSLVEYGISNMYMVLAHQPAGSKALYAIMSVCMVCELLITSLRNQFSGICMKVIIRMIFKNSLRTSYVFFWFTTIHVSVITYSNCTSFVGNCRHGVLFSTCLPVFVYCTFTIVRSLSSIDSWQSVFATDLRHRGFAELQTTCTSSTCTVVYIQKTEAIYR